MYKRKKRRANKGKKKLSIASVAAVTVTSSSSPPPSSPPPASTATTTATTTVEAFSSDETKAAEVTVTSGIMSVTTMIEQVAENQRQPVELTTSNNNNSHSKAVGARKRKPQQISKIVDKLPLMNDHPIDFGAEKNLVHNNNNNNNSPPYKKPCLETSKNGMIKNILSELKTAKMGGSRGDTQVSSRRFVRDEEEDYEEDEEEEDDRSEDEAQLCIKVEEDEAEEDDYDEGVDYSKGNEDAKLVHKRHGLYDKYVSPSLKDRYGAGTSVRGHHNNREGSSHDKTDLADIKSILSNSGLPGKFRSSTPNGWENKFIDEDDSANDEGADLRSVTGNSTGDDELPFRCGVCAYGSCDKSTLLRHMRTHSGERPFQCRLCYFAFTTKANCERHLRNRHGQIDRDQLRDLVVCLPTSSNASESEETEANSNGGVGVQSNPAVALVEPSRRRATSEGTAVAEENDAPLDLSMDAVDLSTKHRDGNPIFRRKASLPRPRPMYAATELSNSLVTSPFISKREPMVHPQLQLNTFAQHPIAPPPPPIVSAHPTHTAFSLFSHFGGPPGFNPFVIPQANVEKLIALGSSSPPKIPIPNPFRATSPTGSFENRDAISSIEKDTKIKVEPATESKRSGSKSTSSSSVSPTTSTSRKRTAENTNGEYQKPKQRRYRTERPFACPHCVARFTLRSNMERHGKHQHPTVWQRSPSNRVINRQKNQQLSPLVGPPTLVHPNKYSGSNNIGSDTPKEKSRDPAVNVNVRAVIAQQLKRKLSNSSLRNNNNGSETETDPENTPAHDKTSGGDTPDLASVSQLLDRVKSSNFAQYFNETESHNFSNDNNSDDDDGGGDSGSGDEDGLSSTEEGDSKTSGGEKKKSAYSSAPMKVSADDYITVLRRFYS